MSTYEIGSIVFDKWKICRELGQGSYGTVYEIQREDFGGVYKAALKVITVPQSRTELQSVLDEGMTPPQAKQYFYSVVEDIGRECAIMSRLKGTANVIAKAPSARRAKGDFWFCGFAIRHLFHTKMQYNYKTKLPRFQPWECEMFMAGKTGNPSGSLTPCRSAATLTERCPSRRAA